MIQHPPWPILGGGPRISGAVVVLSPTDGVLVPPDPGNGYWTDGVGWDPGQWESAWNDALGNLQSLFEIPWGNLRDKLYWYVCAPTDPEAADAPDYLTGALFFQDYITEALNS